MTSLPAQRSPKRLGLIVDLDICVGCHACAVACKAWNHGGAFGPLADIDPYGPDARGPWLCRVLTFEVGEGAAGRTVHFPKSCLHCENAPCVTACPTGASYKRAEDGIVLVDADKCIGCKLCAWACPYGAREYDEAAGVMRKCTLCVDRIYDVRLPERERQPMCVLSCPARARIFGDLADPESEVSRIAAERGGVALLAELGAEPTCLYLPPRLRPSEPPTRLTPEPGGVLGWLFRTLTD